MNLRFQNNTRRFRAALCAGVLSTALCASAQTMAVWTNTVPGTHQWIDGANWLDEIVPNANGAAADFSVNPLLGDIAVELPNDQYINLGRLVLGDAGGQHKITLAGGNNHGITFDNNNGYNDNISLLIQTATSVGDVIAAPIKFREDNRRLIISNLSENAILRLDAKISTSNGNWRNRVFLDHGVMAVGGSHRNDGDPCHTYIRGGVLICENNSGIPLGDPVTVDGGTLRIANPICMGWWIDQWLYIHDGLMDLNGYDSNIYRLGGNGGVITSLPAGEDPVTLRFENNAGPSYGGLIKDGGAPLGLLVTQGELTLSGTNTYSAGTVLKGGTIAIGENHALGTGLLTMGPDTRIRNAGTNAFVVGCDVILVGGYGTRSFGADPRWPIEGEGELAFGNLDFFSANNSYGLDVESTVTFTNAYVQDNFGKSGIGAAIIKGDIIFESYDRHLRVTGGMLACTGDFVGFHKLYLRGPSSTFGLSGERGFILDWRHDGTDQGIDRLCWEGGSNPWEYGGGFSGYDGDLDVTLAIDGNPPNWGAPLAWGVADCFVPAGSPLVFGNMAATHTATLHNDIILSTEAANTVNTLRGLAPIDGRFAGNLTSSGAAEFSKTGNGVLSLAGPANAWLGATEVLGGVLRIDGALSGTSDVFVETNGALSGTGVVTTAGIVVNGALLVESGKGRGLAMNAPVVNLNGALRVYLDGDGLCAPFVNGSLFIDPGAQLDIAAPPVPSANHRRTLLNSGSPINGCFENLPEGSAVITFEDGTSWTISYANNRITIGPPSDATLLMIR